MRVVDASFEIIEEQLEQLTIYERLEVCGRICYKSEEKIDTDSAEPFCRKMITNGHMSTMEMAMLHFHISYFHYKMGMDKCKSDLMKQKYLIVTDVPCNNEMYLSGSVRAFIELFNGEWKDDFQSIYKILNETYPILFPKRDYKDRRCDLNVIEYNPLAMPRNHRYIAVRFIVNRAVTHELVRHRPATFLQESQRYCRYSNDKFGNEVTFIKPTPFFDEETIDYDIWYKCCQKAEIDYLRLLELGNSPQAARTVLSNSCKTEIIVYTSVPHWEHILKLRTSTAAEPSMREVMIPLEKELNRKGFL